MTVSPPISVPPNKRSRCDFNSSSADMPDELALFDAFRNLLLWKRPDLLEKLRDLEEGYFSQYQWGQMPLPAVLQKMATSGLIHLNQNTNRWTLTDVTNMVFPVDPPNEMWTTKFNAIQRTDAHGGETWQGTLARNEKKKIQVAVTTVAGDVISYLEAMGNQISVSLRSPYEEMLKKEFTAVGLIQCATSDSAGLIMEYKLYFQEKNRAGVIRLGQDGNEMMYVVPLSVSGVSRALKNSFGIQPPMDETLLLVVACASSDS